MMFGMGNMMGIAQKKNRLGPVPTLNLQAGGAIPGIITHTRASIANFVNSSGLLESVATDVLRTDYDPLDNSLRGWLIEGASTNELKQSENLEVSWNILRMTQAQDQTNLDGALTASTVRETAVTNTFHPNGSAITPLATTQYTFWVVAKKFGANDYIEVEGLGAGMGFNSAIFNLNTGAVAAESAALDDSGVKDLGGGRYLCWIVFTTVSTASLIPVIYTNTDGASFNQSHVGSTSTGFIYYIGQVEIGANPTSYIKTTTVAVTRAADVISQVSDVSWANNPGPGTLVIEVQAAFWPTASQGVFGLRTSATDRTIIFIDDVFAARSLVAIGNDWNADDSVGPSDGDVVKIALAWQTDDGALYVNGTSRVTTSSLTEPAYTSWEMGSIEGGANLNGWIKSVKYFKSRLTNEQLATQTT